MADHVRSKRFLIVMGLIWLTCFASLYGSLAGIEGAISDDNKFIFLKLFTIGGNSIPSFTSFIALLGPFVGLAMGFDAINGERSRGTLNRLLAQPIYRDAVITGKFLAGAAVVSIMVFAMGIIMGAVGFIFTGIVPSVEEVARLLTALLFTCLYISFWLGLATLFSVICKHAATSALATIACWLFFAIFLGLLARIIADAVYPLDDTTWVINTVKNYALEIGINRISPYYLYSEVISTIMNPNVRSIGVIAIEQFYGALSGYLPYGQSLLLVWPHLFAMIALTVSAFAVSFVCFMRQEVR